MGWQATVVAVSLALIAVVVLTAGVVWLRLVIDLKRIAISLQRLFDGLDRDARPALESARAVADDARKMMETVRDEVVGFTKTSKEIRAGLESTIRATESRLSDLESLLDVVQYEVEETALDLAAALRTTRRGSTVFRTMKRAFLGRRR